VIFLFLFLLFIYFERKREFWIIFFPHEKKKEGDEEIKAKLACVPVLELRSLC
jgi:hypothetical protein